MIKQFIFDIGNVLVDFHPHAFFEKKMPNQDMKKVCDLVFDDIWLELDRGTYLQDVAQEMHLQKHPEYEEQIRYIYAHWLSMMELNQATYTYLKAVKESGKRIYLLSNIGKESYAYLKERYDFFDLADGMVLSYQERCLKPEKVIYEILLERYHLHAEECIFLDDNAKNVEMAKTLGIQAYVFEDVAQVQKEMEQTC